ncbi:MAG: GNAT family N-acetyltransferase, partial [Chlamydiia bacterium]|nr:GNAT family N-acetyltransferase [Chlamydiia bacterium]
MELFEIQPYKPEFSLSCMNLEKACPQGETFRMTFWRKEFHLRSQAFERSNLIVAKTEEGIIGTLGWAIKEVIYQKVQRLAAFFFDFRVSPRFRDKGVAIQLLRAAYRRLDELGIDLRYVYCVGDNIPLRDFISKLFGGIEVGGYKYLVWPVYRKLPVKEAPAEVSPKCVHNEFLLRNNTFDFFCDPFKNGVLRGHLSSYIYRDAGCSIWSNKDILEEVIVKMPKFYSLLKKAVSCFPLNTIRWPFFPALGVPIKSWYLFDFFAFDSEAALKLLFHLNNLALEQEVRFCYLIFSAQFPWISDIKKAGPSIFAPTLPYRLMVK